MPAAKDIPATTAGKPTYVTGVPQPRPYRPNNVMDGIVRGVARNTYTPLADGIIRGSCERMKPDSGLHKVKASATKMAEQEFGGVPYANAKLGR